MSKSLGFSSSVKSVLPFVGAHPIIEKPVTLTSRGEVYTLNAGTVLGKVTSNAKFAPFSPTATDGSQTARAILIEDIIVPATGDEPAVAYFHGEFLKTGLDFGAANAAQIAAAVDALNLCGIYVK